MIMTDTVYNWQKEVKIFEKGSAVKVPTQSILTKEGLEPCDIPVYVKPYVQPSMSRGVMDYDPLGNA